MSNVDKAERAKEVYETLCAALESRNWHYKREDELKLVHFSVHGDDLPMKILMVVDEERMLVRVMSGMPFTMKEEKRIEGAIMTCAATSKLANGCFDYDITKGTITFRITASYRETMIGEGLFSYLIDCTTTTVDQFNDLFFAVNEGMISLQDFLKKI